LEARERCILEAHLVAGFDEVRVRVMVRVRVRVRVREDHLEAGFDEVDTSKLNP